MLTAVEDFTVNVDAALVRWFGNLMTLSWWDDLWLNEGFASYIEYKGVAQYHTDWDMEAQFLVEDLHPVLDLDSTVNSHPIVQPVEHPNQVGSSRGKFPSYSVLSSAMGRPNQQLSVALCYFAK